jgi:predicted phosphohydrolase
MTLFAIADPHLGRAVDKPMDVFGARWERHAERLAENWRATVGDDDWVLVPGDISWALRLEEAIEDLAFLGALPGKKLLLKGNHDYWWTSRAKVERILPPGMHLLQNDAFDLGGGVGVVGTRGWTPPGFPGAGAQDARIYAREVERLKLSIKAAAGRFACTVAMLHYPPLYRGQPETAFAPLLRAAGVAVCLYGHLHGAAHETAVQGVVDKMRYVLVAADFVDFTPLRVPLEVDGGQPAP